MLNFHSLLTNKIGPLPESASELEAPSPGTLEKLGELSFFEFMQPVATTLKVLPSVSWPKAPIANSFRSATNEGIETSGALFIQSDLIPALPSEPDNRPAEHSKVLFKTDLVKGTQVLPESGEMQDTSSILRFVNMVKLEKSGGFQSAPRAKTFEDLTDVVQKPVHQEPEATVVQAKEPLGSSTPSGLKTSSAPEVQLKQSTIVFGDEADSILDEGSSTPELSEPRTKQTLQANTVAESQDWSSTRTDLLSVATTREDQNLYNFSGSTLEPEIEAVEVPKVSLKPVRVETEGTTPDRSRNLIGKAIAAEDEIRSKHALEGATIHDYVDGTEPGRNASFITKPEVTATPETMLAASLPTEGAARPTSSDKNVENPFDLRTRAVERIEVQKSYSVEKSPSSIPLPLASTSASFPSERRLIPEAVPEFVNATTPLSHSVTQPSTPMPANMPSHAMGTIQVQILEAIQTAGTSNIEVRLEPEELGKLRIVMSPREGGMHVLVLADRTETLDLMRRHATDLENYFSDAGYESTDIDFEAYRESDQEYDGRDLLDEFDDVASESKRSDHLREQFVDGRLDIRF